MVAELDKLKDSLIPEDANIGADGVVTSDKPPVLYESDFYTLPWEEDYYHGNPIEIDEGQVIDLSKDSYFMPFFGPKRSGKSLLMIFWCVKCMGLWNMPCWSNIPIKFIWHDRRGQERLCESFPLDPVSLALSKNYHHGVCVIDELPLYLNSKNAMSTKNKVLGLVLQQMGKKKLSFLCTAQNPRSIDGITSWQMDVCFQVQDKSKAYPQMHLPRGQFIEFTATDNSGQWTGKPYEMSGEVLGPWTLCHAEKLWTAYKSYEEVDILDSLRGWDIDLTKTKLTDKPQQEDIQKQLVAVLEGAKRAGMTQITTEELWGSIPGGDNVGLRSKNSQFLRALNLKRRQRADGERFYDLTEYDGAE